MRPEHEQLIKDAEHWARLSRMYAPDVTRGCEFVLRLTDALREGDKDKQREMNNGQEFAQTADEWKDKALTWKAKALEYETEMKTVAQKTGCYCAVREGNGALNHRATLAVSVENLRTTNVRLTESLSRVNAICNQLRTELNQWQRMCGTAKQEKGNG